MYYCTAMTTRSHPEYSIVLQNSFWQLLHRSCMKGRRLYFRVGVSMLAKVSPSVTETRQEDTVRRLRGDGRASARSGRHGG